MGLDIDLAAVVRALGGDTSEEDANDAGIPAGAELMAFAAAAYDGRVSLALDQARERLLAVVGADGLREAAATIAIFNGLVRVADGTGIQLDPNLIAASARSREELGLDQFSGSANTESTPGAGLANKSADNEAGFGSVHNLFGQP